MIMTAAKKPAARKTAPKKPAATTPVEAPVSVDAPAVAPESAKPPVAPLVLPEQVVGYGMLMKLEDMTLEDQDRLDSAMAPLAARLKEKGLSEVKMAIIFRDFLADYALDRDEFLELFKGGDARTIAFNLYATWMTELKK